MEQADYPHLY